MQSFLITMACTVIFDLTIAVLVGVAFSFLLFVAKASNIEINVSKVENEKLRGTDADVERIHKKRNGCLHNGKYLFGNSSKLNTAIEQLPACDEIIFSLRGVSAIDTSGAQNLHEICEALLAQNVSVCFCGVQSSVREMLQRAGIEALCGGEAFYWALTKRLWPRWCRTAF